MQAAAAAMPKTAAAWRHLAFEGPFPAVSIEFPFPKYSTSAFCRIGALFARTGGPIAATILGLVKRIVLDLIAHA